MKRRAGFTLVELAVALSVAVVLACMVVVRVDGWSSGQKLRTSARNLGNAIRLYRAMAQEREETYTMRIELDHGTYTVALRGETIRSGRLAMDQSFGKVFSGGAEIPTPAILTLTPRGLLPETELAVGNSSGERVTLRVKAMTNEVAYAEAR